MPSIDTMNAIVPYALLAIGALLAAACRACLQLSRRVDELSKRTRDLDAQQSNTNVAIGALRRTGLATPPPLPGPDVRTGDVSGAAQAAVEPQQFLGKIGQVTGLGYHPPVCSYHPC